MIDQDLLEGNKYFRWYWSICNNAKDRILSPDIYTENHHIYPKSIYGQNQDLVKLTAKEHYIVHLLLWWGLRTKYGIKDVNTKRMCYGFHAMNMKNECITQNYNSKKYSYLKIARSEMFVSEETIIKMKKPKTIEHAINISKGLKNKPSEFYKERAKQNIGKKRNIEQCKKMSDSQKKRIENLTDDEYLKFKNKNLGKKATEKTKELLSIAHSGEKNGNYGKGYYKIWIDKYGKDVADIMENERKIKRKMNYNNKTKDELELIQAKRLETRRKNKVIKDGK